MESRYRWSDSDIEALRANTETVRRALVEAFVLVNRLTADMAADTAWSSDHKIAFVAWMDLLRQFHEQMAGPDVGMAAVDDLNDFLSALSGYYQDSQVYGTLRSIT